MYAIKNEKDDILFQGSNSEMMSWVRTNLPLEQVGLANNHIVYMPTHEKWVTVWEFMNMYN